MNRVKSSTHYGRHHPYPMEGMTPPLWKVGFGASKTDLESRVGEMLVYDIL
jgi:hypothetical protein